MRAGSTLVGRIIYIGARWPARPRPCYVAATMAAERTPLTQRLGHAPVERRDADVVRFPPMQGQFGSIGYLEKMVIGELLLVTEPRFVVETGTFWGQTTRFLAEFVALNGLPGCRIVSFDLAKAIDDLRRADDFFERHPEVELVPGRLPGSLKRFLATSPEPVDFAIVDASHRYAAVAGELAVLHPRLRAGAYVFCHDYRPQDAGYEGTVYAVEHFAARRGYHLLPLVSRRTQGPLACGAALLRKPGDWKRSRLRGLRHRLKALRPR
jgi:hypothetical protein